MSYAFNFATPENHFVTRYIKYGNLCTDASWDYHEAAAIWLLSVLSKRVRAYLVFYRNGLPTNMYIMLIGSTSASHKTTCLNMAKGILKEAMPNSLLEEKLTPEALVEQMALKGDSPAAWATDEFSFMFKGIAHKSYMKDFPEIIMRLYDGNNYDIARHSKRVKGGEKEEDKEIIENPHLCIIAPTTQAVFASLTQEHLESGLLPRFAIVMPPDKPARKPFYFSNDEVVGLANEGEKEIISWAKDLHTFLNRSPVIKFSHEALVAVDEFSVEIESEDAKSPESVESYMRKRLEAMLLKLSMLIAIGSPTIYSTTNEIPVTEADVRCAMKIARKWKGYAEQFASRIAESEFEGKLQRGLKMLEAQKTVRRDLFARHVKVPHHQLQSVIDTLCSRGYAQVVAGDGIHPKLKYVNGHPQDLSEVKPIEVNA